MGLGLRPAWGCGCQPWSSRPTGEWVGGGRGNFVREPRGIREEIGPVDVVGPSIRRRGRRGDEDCECTDGCGVHEQRLVVGP
jgi:hypothetical protein